MRRVLQWTLICVCLALAVAGCGGKKTYSLASTTSCLQRDHLRIGTAKDDFVASTAPGGAVRVVFDRRNEVTISFAGDKEEAQRIVLGYQRFAGKNIGLADVLRPQENAVLLWEAHPTDQDLAAVGKCLK
jgi:ABC-type thiamine transport system substrate-binding protein